MKTEISTRGQHKLRSFGVFSIRYPIFYGWWLVLITLVLSAVVGAPVWGGVGVWVESLEQHFGWSRTQLALAFSLGQLEGGLSGPLVGYLGDRLGARKVVLIGVSITGVGFILLGQTSSLVIFYVSYGTIMLGASMAAWLPMMTAINHWFDRRKSVAMGIGSLGFSMGGLVLIPVLAWAVNPEHFGWKTTAMGIGVMFLVMAWPMTRLIRNRPEEYGEVPDGVSYHPGSHPSGSVSGRGRSLTDAGFTAREALREKAFWLIAVGHGLATMLIATLTVHLIPSLVDQGISLQTASVVWGTMMGVSGVAQLFGGYIGDKVPKNIVLCVFGCVQALGIVLAAFTHGLPMAFLFALVYGVGFGTRIPLGTAIRGEYFGKKAFGTILGISMVPMVLLAMIGPISAGLVFDSRGSYFVAFIALAILSCGGSLLFLFAKKPVPPGARKGSAAVAPAAARTGGCGRFP